MGCLPKTEISAIIVHLSYQLQETILFEGIVLAGGMDDVVIYSIGGFATAFGISIPVLVGIDGVEHLFSPTVVDDNRPITEVSRFNIEYIVQAH